MKLPKYSLLRIFCWILLIFSPLYLIAEQPNDNNALLLQVNGAISPASQDYLERGIKRAAKDRAKLVIIQLDTPGGLDTSMRGIIKAIINSPVPVVSYVGPSGARAASAGTYILYASHIAAMAPGTNLGAATPVSIAPAAGAQNPKEKPKEKPAKTAMEKKVINDAVAYIKSLSQLRDRNETWAEKAVRQGASIPANTALKMNVIDVIAKDIPTLLQKIDGRKVKVRGELVTLKTQGMRIERVLPDWRTKFLSVITNPSVAYILMLLGIYGLFFELANPGFILPGVVGAICLLLALYAFQLLPINYAGLGLMLLGIAFLVGEAFMPSFGVLGIGGIIAFITGSILLLDSEATGLGIGWPLILSMALINGLFFTVIVSMAIKARRRRVVSGHEALIGIEVLAMEDFHQEGRVKLHGESWQAQSDVPVRKGEILVVYKVKGLTAWVKPKERS